MREKIWGIGIALLIAFIVFLIFKLPGYEKPATADFVSNAVMYGNNGEISNPIFAREIVVSGEKYVVVQTANSVAICQSKNNIGGE